MTEINLNSLAIMQPYLFPYIGYFQLIQATEKFVVYDDVAYIKQGWIARNRILLNGKDHLFSVPVATQSSFRQIRETEVNERLYSSWADKFLKTIIQGYKKAPLFTPVYAILESTLKSENKFISKLAVNSIANVCSYLELPLNMVYPDKYNNNHLSGKDRVIDICQQEKTGRYINVSGGKELYDKEEFKQHNIKLDFIRSSPSIRYQQFPNNDFVPWLSIIDVLMFNSPETVREFLTQHTFE